MSFNFDQVIDRRHSNSTKWQKFPPNVRPHWVADMDFAAPDFILDALRQRLEHPILGYTDKPAALTEAFQAWLERHFDWQIPAEWVVWLPAVVPGLNLAAQTLPRGADLMVNTPIYHPFLEVAANAQLRDLRVPLVRDLQQNDTEFHQSHWGFDWQAMQDAFSPTHAGKPRNMLAICNPQNPTGRVYTQAELLQLANFVEDNNLLLVSDEIHANIILDADCNHLPIAKVAPEIADRTISLYAATKIYNIPGVSCAAAVIPNEALRDEFLAARRGLVHGIGPLGFAAAEVAFNDRSSWIPELMAYLRENLSLIQSTQGERLSPLQATYLAWLDVADLNLADTEQYFAEHGLGISPGAQFGDERYIRLNFGCPKAALEEALGRLTTAINQAKNEK